MEIPSVFDSALGNTEKFEYDTCLCWRRTKGLKSNHQAAESSKHWTQTGDKR